MDLTCIAGIMGREIQNSFLVLYIPRTKLKPVPTLQLSNEWSTYISQL